MAVRFLPPPEERAPTNRDAGENLAEVVEMRSWLRPVNEESNSDEMAGAADHHVEHDGENPEGVPPGGNESTDWSVDGPAEDNTSIGEEPVDDEATAGATIADEPARIAPVTRGLFGSATESSGRTVGGEVTAELDEIEGTSARDEVYEDAVRLLARRARSSGELRDDLLALDHSVDAVMIVIDEFHDSHYLDDVGLARVQSEKLRDSKGASRGQITRKLRERKLPDEVIEEIIGELDTDEEYELLREAAHKRAKSLNGLERETAKRRLLGFLARRGWSGEPAMRAVNEALDGTGRQERGGRGSGGVRFE